MLSQKHLSIVEQHVLVAAADAGDFLDDSQCVLMLSFFDSQRNARALQRHKCFPSASLALCDFPYRCCAVHESSSSSTSTTTGQCWPHVGIEHVVILSGRIRLLAFPQKFPFSFYASSRCLNARLKLVHYLSLSHLTVLP